MLIFVVKAVKAPGSVQVEETERPKETGWQIRGLVDALAHGVNMIDDSIMKQAVKMDQDCIGG